jgi:multiple sugar transport system substrate-binding protein
MTTRRSFTALLGATAIGLSAAVAMAQDKPDKLEILAHRVHATVATGTQGGDITEAWQQENGIGVEWITMDTGPLMERLFRELTLPETSIDLAFLLNTRAVPSVANLLEPLDSYQDEEPIEEFDDIFPGLVEPMRFEGKLYGIPFRHASTCLHYNEKYLKAVGLETPETMEQVLDAARKMTGTAEDGTEVSGLLIEGSQYANMIDFGRAWNGDFITLDYKLAVTEPGMRKGIEALAALYEEGVLPKSWASIKTEDVNTGVQTGRAAMVINSCGRNRIYNDPEKSKVAGNIRTVALPVSEELQGEFDVAPAKVEFWSIVIPKNAQHKEAAWSLLRTMLSKENTLKAALNGNGPVRASTYANPDFSGKLPYADAELAVLKAGRVPLPAFDDAAKAGDIFVEEVQAAVLGMKPVEDALNDIAKRVQPLLPKS